VLNFSKHFATDLPAAQGHFPGDPMVPGAVLLAAAARVLEDNGILDVGYRVVSAKFLRVVRPGAHLGMCCERREGGRIMLVGEVEGKAVMKAELRCSPASMP